MIPELKQALHGRRKRKHKGVRNVCAFVHGRDGEQPKKGVVCACVCAHARVRLRQEQWRLGIAAR